MLILSKFSLSQQANWELVITLLLEKQLSFTSSAQPLLLTNKLCSVDRTEYLDVGAARRTNNEKETVTACGSGEDEVRTSSLERRR